MPDKKNDKDAQKDNHITDKTCIERSEKIYRRFASGEDDTNMKIKWCDRRLNIVMAMVLVLMLIIVIHTLTSPHYKCTTAEEVSFTTIDGRPIGDNSMYLSCWKSYVQCYDINDSVEITITCDNEVVVFDGRFGARTWTKDQILVYNPTNTPKTCMILTKTETCVII